MKDEEIAKDFFGNTISEGVEVAFMQTGYRQLLKGTVVKITNKTVLISHERTNTGKTETKQEHEQVIVKKSY